MQPHNEFERGMNMERTNAIEKVLPFVTAQQIVDALDDISDALFNSGYGSQVHADFSSALMFCIGVAVGKHEDRQKKTPADLVHQQA